MVLLATRFPKGNRRIGPVPLDCEVDRILEPLGTKREGARHALESMS